MNRDDARRVLAFRAQLTRIGYVDETITAWADALHDISEADAKHAIRDLANNSTTSIAIPEIRTWLRDRARRHQLDHPATQPDRPTATPEQARTASSIRFAAHNPNLLQARRQWWTDGAPGHYPECPCDNCTRHTSTSDRTADLWKQIKPLHHP